MMLELTTHEVWEALVENQLFTDSELELLTNINGYNVETLNDAIYSRYGYPDYKELFSESETELKENKNGGNK